MLKKSEEYDRLMKDVIQLFDNEWSVAHNKVAAVPANRAVLKKYAASFLPQMFRKWFFSTMVEQTLLSPANVVVALNRDYGVDEQCTPRLTTSIDPETQECVMEYNIDHFSAEESVLINDLKCFLREMPPTFDATAPDSWHLPGLSMSCGDYREFLYTISLKLQLVHKMPSLRNTVAMVTRAWSRFFEKPYEEIMIKIVNAVVDSFVDELKFILPVSPNFRNKVLGYIKRPISVDEIFQEIFEHLGFDINEFLDGFTEAVANDVPDFSALDSMIAGLHEDGVIEGTDEITNAEMRESLMSGAYFLGLTLDRCLITPLAYYCRLIQPLYIIPFEFDKEIEYAVELAVRMEQEGSDVDLSDNLYTPCSVYALMKSGEALVTRMFGTLVKNDDDVFLPQDTNAKQLIEHTQRYFASVKSPKTEGRTGEKQTQLMNVFTVKITPKDERDAWVNVELPDCADMNDLHDVIRQIYYFEKKGKYAVRHVRTKALGGKVAYKDVEIEHVTLDEFFSEKSDGKIAYLMYNSDYDSPSFDFDIRIIKQEVKGIDMLPRVVRMGRGFEVE